MSEESEAHCYTGTIKISILTIKSYTFELFFFSSSFSFSFSFSSFISSPPTSGLPRFRRSGLVSVDNLNDINSTYDLDGGKVMGSGATSTVKTIRHKITKVEYALKSIRLNRMDKKKRAMLLEEVNLMRQMDNPYIVKIVATFVRYDFHDFFFECFFRFPLLNDASYLTCLSNLLQYCCVYETVSMVNSLLSVVVVVVVVVTVFKFYI